MMKFDVSALNELAVSKNATLTSVVAVVEKAFSDAYAKTPGAEPGANAVIDTKRGELTIFTEDGTDVTPSDFSRLAATTMRQAVVMWIRDLERRAKLGAWADRQDTLVTGKVRADARRNARGETIIDLGGGVEASMPSGEAVPGEVLEHGDEVTVYAVAVNPDERGRVRVTASRRQPLLVSALVTANSPEIRSGKVELVGVVREPGIRSKVAVRGPQAAEAVFGGGAYRIRLVAEKITRGEKIDVVVDPGTVEGFVAAALTPAKVDVVEPDPDVPNGFIARVAADQLPLAVGKDGRNARMAAKLTGVRLKVVAV